MKLYLDTVHQVQGDWIVYRAPCDGGGLLAYLAAARVVDVIDDPLDPTHAYTSGYLPFDAPVSFSSGGSYEEELLRSPARDRTWA